MHEPIALADGATITVRQDEPWSIRLLAAQRQLYREAKRWRFGRAAALVALALAGLLVGAVWPQPPLVMVLLGAALTLLDWAIIAPLQDRKTKAAANIQEQFDTSVFGLPWNAWVAGPKLDPEEVLRADRRYTRPRDDLAAWYSPRLAPVPAPYSVLICQRSNLRWDIDLRRGWALASGAGVVLLCLVALTLRLPSGMTAAEFATTYAPLLPILRAGVAYAWGHNKRAGEQAALKWQLEGAWEQALAGRQPIAPTTYRDVQDRIFSLRVSSAPIPDWWHSLHRARYQTEMHNVVEHMCGQFEAAARAGLLPAAVP